jgi:transcriptional regulator with XRE-family HTH domain
MAIGATLRQAREERGLSLDRLAKTTRVQPRLLEAIERDDHTRLPPRPFARGMVCAYAREVGLDPDHTVHDYFEEIDRREAEAAAALPAVRPPVDRPRPGVVAPALLVIAVLAIGVAVSLNMSSGPADDRLLAVGTTGSTEPIAAPTTGLVSAPAVQPAPSRNEIVVLLEATNPSWVAASTDGTRVLYRTLQPGERETLRAAREIALRIGNAGGITWTVNGQPRGVMGTPGEVRDVALSPKTASTVR